MPRHATNTCFLVHSQEKILLSLTLVRIGEMIQEMPFRMSFPHVLMAGRPQQILHLQLKYLFGYFKIRIFYCSNRMSNDAVWPESGMARPGLVKDQWPAVNH